MIKMVDQPHNHRTNVRFTCPNCQKPAKCVMEVPLVFVWDANDTARGDSDIQCNRCQHYFDVELLASGYNLVVKNKGFADAVVDVDTPFYGAYVDDPDWDVEPPPPNPYSIFEESYTQLLTLFANSGMASSGLLFNRMVFVQLFAALESFLGDTLINAVASDHEAMQRLLQKEKTLSEKGFTLPEIASDPDIVRKYVTNYLRNHILYHNLPYVDGLYLAAFGVRILPDAPTRARLIRATGYRHDCVHRNGVNKNGEKLTVFSKT